MMKVKEIEHSEIVSALECLKINFNKVVRVKMEVYGSEDYQEDSHDICVSKGEGDKVTKWLEFELGRIKGFSWEYRTIRIKLIKNHNNFDCLKSIQIDKRNDKLHIFQCECS